MRKKKRVDSKFSNNFYITIKMVSVLVLTSPFVHMSFTPPRIDMVVPSVPQVRNLSIPNTLEVKKDIVSDYDYDECTDLQYFRRSLSDLGLNWPLTSIRERYLLDEMSKKYPNQSDFEAMIIKEAFLQAGEAQKDAMKKIASRIDYHL